MLKRYFKTPLPVELYKTGAYSKQQNGIYISTFTHENKSYKTFSNDKLISTCIIMKREKICNYWMYNKPVDVAKYMICEGKIMLNMIKTTDADPMPERLNAK